MWWILLAVIDMLCGDYWWLSLICCVVDTVGCQLYVVWWILLAIIDMLCGGYCGQSLICCMVVTVGCH